MKLSWPGWVRKRRQSRLKASEQQSPKGLSAFAKKPVVGYSCWLLMWLAVWLLSITAADHVSRLSVGQTSPMTLIASVEFAYSPDPESPDDHKPREMMIPQGSVLVERGRMVTPETLDLVEAYRRQTASPGSLAGGLARAVGDGIILLVGVLICMAMFRLFTPDIAARNSMLLLFLAISLLTIVPSRWFHLLERFPFYAHFSGFEALLPLSLSPLLAAILVGPLPAVSMGFWVSLSVAVFSGYSLAVFITGFTAALVVARMTRFVRTRASFLRLGLFAGLAGAACTLGFSTAASHSAQVALSGSLFTVASGIFSALIALLLLPLFEVLFGISTDISLLELSDLEHPLLKRLSIEAPGTYHHSLMVANLAQAAVAAIGGNALRLSICAYFHDIGKLVKPAFFSENTRFAASPHDDLSPSMSTLVVISHVKEGVNLALRHKLPKPVVSAIQQHHGTGIVYYFYHKARENTQYGQDPHAKVGAPEVKAEDFRYPGPRPQSREIAVLTLADSIEAASRSLEKISSGHVEHLVNDIVNMKLGDGQLDLCGLTLSEIGKIKKAFIFTLTNMLHSRVSYPNNEHRNNRQAAPGESKRVVDEETDPAPDEKGLPSR